MTYISLDVCIVSTVYCHAFCNISIILSVRHLLSFLSVTKSTATKNMTAQKLDRSDVCFRTYMYVYC